MGKHEVKPKPRRGKVTVKWAICVHCKRETLFVMKSARPGHNPFWCIFCHKEQRMPKVYNKHHKDAPKDAIYVGRPSKWGNPFKIGDESYYPGTPMTRQDAVDHFRASVAFPELQAEIRHDLRGKDLVCWCAPAACHADVLLEIANA